MPILTDTGAAESAWRSLVTPQNLYDEWAFRHCFFDQANQALAFHVDCAQRPRFLLPLQRHLGNGNLSFLGAPFMERNRSFCRQGAEKLMVDAYQALDGELSLDDICELDPITRSGLCITSDPAFQLEKDVVQFAAPEDLVRFVPKNIRENIRKNQKRVDRGEMSIDEGDLLATLESIRKLSHDRFGDDSWLELDYMRNGFERLETLARELDATLQCVQLLADQRCVAGCISIRYRADFYMLMAAAVHHHDFSGIGSYLYHVCMSRAFADGCDRIDTGIGDGGWKERWGLEKIPQFKFDSLQVLAD